LAALTPAHRTLLANVVGGLAIAANPNVDEAAARLDAALSSGEKDAIVRIHTDAMTKMHEMMPARPSGMPAGMGARPAPDAGHLLLMMAAPPMMMQMMHMHRGAHG
jgi:hypothetical protein